MANALDVTPHARLTRVPIEKSNREKDGAIWNLLIAKVYTPFVFLGMDLVYFDSDIDLRRMVSSITLLL